MATKTEQFRHDAERGKRHDRPKKRTHGHRRETTDVGAHNLSRHGERKANVAAEESHKKPSRKSSRPSANRGKNSGMLEYASRQRSFSPEKRHSRR